MNHQLDVMRVGAWNGLIVQDYMLWETTCHKSGMYTKRWTRDNCDSEEPTVLESVDSAISAIMAIFLVRGAVWSRGYSSF